MTCRRQPRPTVISLTKTQLFGSASRLVQTGLLHCVRNDGSGITRSQRLHKPQHLRRMPRRLQSAPASRRSATLCRHSAWPPSVASGRCSRPTVGPCFQGHCKEQHVTVKEPSFSSSFLCRKSFQAEDVPEYPNLRRGFDRRDCVDNFKHGRLKPYAVPPTVSPSIRSVGCPTPTGTLWPSLPQVPTPESISMSLPIMETRVSTSGPLPIRVAPLTG